MTLERKTSKFREACDAFGDTPVPASVEHERLLHQCLSQVSRSVLIGKRAGLPMRLEIGFIDDPSFNGWATTIDDTDVIALTTGVPALMARIWRALLSHPVVMPEIGSAADCTPRSFPASVTVPPEDYRLWPDGALECGVREALANHLSIGSVIHTFLHEFIHIWHGHTDFIAEKYGLRRYIENDSSSSGLTFQTIEWDADTGATHQMLKLFLMPRVEIVRGLAKWHLDGRECWMIYGSRLLGLT